jgi:hypothetical protein
MADNIVHFGLLNVSIKTPQLIGIVAGCLVFVITISVVFYLLYASGSLAKLAHELSNNVEHLDKSRASVVAGVQFVDQPELYEDLLRARENLALKPSIPVQQGKNVLVKSFEVVDTAEVASVSDGRAIFQESEYDPVRLTGWLDTEVCPDQQRTIADLLTREMSDGVHLCIVDKELRKIVGGLSLADNCPRNLSVRIGMSHCGLVLRHAY